MKLLITLLLIHLLFKSLALNNDSIELANPMSSNQDVMRPSLIPGLLNNFEYNFNRGAQKFRIFEVGNVFTKEDSWKSLAGLLYFDKSSSDWSGSFQSSFYDLRKSLDMFFSRLNIEPIYNKASQIICIQEYQQK